METSGSVPGSAVAPDEVVDLVRRPGPFATVLLCTQSDIENASQRSEQRWKPLRAELLDQGAPDEVVAAVDPLVAEAHLYGEGLAVVVPASGGAHVEHLPEAPDRDVVRWGTLPLLAPLLASHQRSIAHVVVLIDRLGADLHGVSREGADLEVAVKGDDHPIQRSKPGGWSQRRYQERVQSTWDQNAGEVADAVVRLVERLDAHIVLVAGDVRAVQLLRQRLPDHVACMLREVDGSRATDGSEAITEAEVRTWLATAVADDTRRLLEKLREEGGQHDRAADGLEATMAALSEARAAALLVPTELDGPGLWFGADTVPVAASRQALIDLGGDEPQEGPAVDVLIRAALGTGAAVRIIPAGALPDQVGAILRW
ncbi:MAG: hypothetical protein AVDCRST_MAG76-2275 [uncultured Acidimicrobiales bacterium]|uniref:Peptide chain release factor 1 n=1 Tax=uncultured Acidimicrobiales bacterium TaxID=310071 RepID=A0A6J4IIM5_9ACTN|nr:MAG: hypothetical protein AVDCRST_MAG76-2275 [uncultured Acidimicrobiales bacterium]